MTDRPLLGFAGLGLMGGPMAGRLLDAGFPLIVWNRSAEKTAPFAARGARAAARPAALADAEIVFLNLMDLSAVEAVVFGPGGLAEGRGGIVADFSTIPPGATRALAARLEAANGGVWVDAPVSGGAVGAAEGTLAVMAGGPAAAVARLRPILSHLAARVTHMGAVGAGQATKLVNQIVAGCTLAVTAEAVAFAERTGVDPALLAEALAGGFADSKPFRIFAPRMAARTYDPPLGATDTMIKDLAEVERAAAATGARTPLVAAALGAMRASAAQGDGGRDIAAIVEIWRQEGRE